ncbi:S8 family serine peptidase [Cognatiyoonia sp. IB215446]|uniref:S8 family peptidase n=1 Tax=Cognatiyoonia sp. IB215446 TaxID=3097355 RepID=UPI002A10B2EE|nr:S8 family serine peptidase [Cognatiyoonia sp. IB215446]MDX8346891.1 S8 family serine peptidase [Cognatiyoonia sp. IB215446]
MTLARLFLMMFFSLTMATTGQAQHAEAEDWRLADADQISSDKYLILTVALADRARLSAVTDGIETTFGVPLTAEWPLQSIDVHCLVFDATDVTDVDALMRSMRQDVRIETVQRMQSFEVSAHSYTDTLFPLQWSLDRMDVVEAHAVSTGRGVTIGVVDTAIDQAHADLARQLQDTRDFVAASSAHSAETHGTAIAAVIAADATNGSGIVGVAPDAMLIGLRACWEEDGQPGRCSSFSLARALNFAILNQVAVINLSVGGRFDPLLEDLVLAALNAGIVVVAASGETQEKVFPAAIPGVIAAAGLKSNGIPAPMIDVISAAPGNRHRYVSGSSISAAHVSGVVALLLAARTDLTTFEVTQALQDAVVTSGTAMPMLNACAVLRAVTNTTMSCAQS